MAKFFSWLFGKKEEGFALFLVEFEGRDYQQVAREISRELESSKVPARTMELGDSSEARFDAVLVWVKDRMNAHPGNRVEWAIRRVGGITRVIRWPVLETYSS